MGIFHSSLWLIRLSVKCRLEYWVQKIHSWGQSYIREQEEIWLFIMASALLFCDRCWCDVWRKWTDSWFLLQNQITCSNKVKPSKRILYVTVEMWQVREYNSSCVFKYSSRRVESSLVSGCSNEWPTYSGFIEVSILLNDSFVEKMEDLSVTQGCLCEGDKLPPCDQ